MTDALNKIGRSFGWLRQPYHLLILTGIVGLAMVLGLRAYEQPLTYKLNVGGVDAPLVANAAGRDIYPGGNMRWVRNGGTITIPGVSASHPLTLSIFAGGAGRADIKQGIVISFTISVNGHSYPPQRLYDHNVLYTWRVEREEIGDGPLEVGFHIPNQKAALLLWSIGIAVDQLAIDPATDPGQQLSPYMELDWRYLLCLAAIPLLIYSFFAAVGWRRMLLGLSIALLLLVWFANLLNANRPLLGVFASVLVLGLLVVRILIPVVGGWVGQRRVVLWLFLLTFGVGMLLVLPDFQSQDDVYRYLVSESILTRGTVMLPPPQTDMQRPYSRYALGQSVLMLPFLQAGLWVQQAISAPNPIRYLFVILLNPLVSALGVVLLFLCARRMFGHERLAIALSLIYFFATFAFAYAIQSWTEPTVAMLLLLAFYAMLRVFPPTSTTDEQSVINHAPTDIGSAPMLGEQGEANPNATPPNSKLKTQNSKLFLLLAGFALGYALFVKEEYVIVAAIFGVWWAARRGNILRQAGMRGPQIARSLCFEGLALGVPIIVFEAADLCYNYVRNGNLFAAGYIQANILDFSRSPFVGLYGLLFSPGKGILIFAPPVLLCLWAAGRLWLGWRWEGALIGILFGQALAFYCTYYFWQGGVCWGPRFLLPYLPLLMLASGPALLIWRNWHRWQRWGYRGLVAVGVLIAALGVLTDMGESNYYGFSFTGFQTDSISWLVLTAFSPAQSYIAHAWDLLAKGFIQPHAMFQLSYYHFPAFANQLVPGLLLGLIGVAGLQVSRLYRSGHELTNTIEDNAVVAAPVLVNLPQSAE